jgi:hypothetical protein
MALHESHTTIQLLPPSDFFVVASRVQRLHFWASLEEEAELEDGGELWLRIWVRAGGEVWCPYVLL